MTKTCNKCKETKPLTEFSKRTDSLDGFYCHCKACRNSRSAEYHAENSEKAKARMAKYRANNPDKVAASSAKWNAENLETRCIYEHNRRARKRENGGELSKDIAGKLFVLQKGKCACGCKQPLGDDYHRDHIMPIALGGANTNGNIQLLRQRCNIQKSAKHPIDFMQSRGFLL